MLNSLCDEIESIEFSSLMNVHSGFKSFYGSLQREAVVLFLIDYLKQNTKESFLVYQRAIYLLEDYKDSKHAHPFDVALAGYLYVLRQINLLHAEALAKVIDRTPNLWWARKLVENDSI